MENRRLLGEETITILSGEKRDIKVYELGFIEKINLIKKHTKKQFIKGFLYKDLDEESMILEVLTKCIKGVNIDELGYNAQLIYQKYFIPKDDDEENKKKGHTSTTGQVD